MLLYILAFAGAEAIIAGDLVADTVIIENRVTGSVSTGGNSANGGNGADGEDGEDGRDGEDGAVMEGKSKSSITIKSTVNGKVVEDFHQEVENSSVTREHTNTSEDATVETTVNAAAAAKEPATIEDAAGTEDTEVEVRPLSSSTPQPDAQVLASASSTSLEAEAGIGALFRAVAGAITGFLYGIFR
jgi:hypothetical protein